MASQDDVDVLLGGLELLICSLDDARSRTEC